MNSRIQVRRKPWVYMSHEVSLYKARETERERDFVCVVKEIGRASRETERFMCDTINYSSSI